MSTVQHTYRQTWCVVNWSHLRILRKRESAWWFSHAVCDIMSLRKCSNYFKLFNEEIWIVQDDSYFTSTAQRQTVPLHVLSILSRQACHQLEKFFEICLFRDRRSNIPTQLSADSDRYRSIGPPLAKTKGNTLWKKYNRQSQTSHSDRLVISEDHRVCWKTVGNLLWYYYRGCVRKTQTWQIRTGLKSPNWSNNPL